MKIRVGEVNTKFVAFLAIVAAFATVLTIGVGTAQAAVGGPTCNVPTDYPTIQAAVNDPGCSTINVAAGTYTENVVINRTLTLNGAQAGFGACGRVASESIVTPLNPLVRTLELQGSLGVTIVINGFTFLGGTRAIESTTGPINGLQLLNNRIRGFTDNGVFLNDNGINITVDQNEIDGTAKVGSGALFHLDQDNFDGFWFTNNCVMNGHGTPPGSGTGFFVDGTRNVDHGTAGSRIPLFSGNFIDNNGTGVNLGRKAWGDGPITGNTFSNNLFDGLQGGPRNSLITKNTFANNGGNGLGLTGFGGATDSTRGAQFNTITQNCFTGNGLTNAGAGISFSASQFPGTISTNHTNQNNIFGNAFGARYNGTETIDAEQNWWGSPTGPFNLMNNPTGTGNAVSDNVDAYPFLTSVAAGTPCTPLPLATLTLSPPTATNDVDTQHTVTATVEDMNGNPVPNVIVRFTVTGSVNTSGMCTTNTSGQCTFTYTGPALPGADVITAFADTNSNGTQDAGEPDGAATKVWTVPVSTPLCQVDVTYGGWIHASNGDRANFGGNAKVDSQSNPLGQEEYQDQGPAQPMNVHSINVLAVVCPGDPPTEASIFGEATIDGAGSFIYRIDVEDHGESGRGLDKYQIRLSNGYDSGDQLLEGGNIQIHK